MLVLDRAPLLPLRLAACTSGSNTAASASSGIGVPWL